MNIGNEIKEKIDEIVKTIKSDPNMLQEFTKEPIKTVEKLLNVDLPDEKLTPIVEGVKAKLAVSGIEDKLSGLKGLFK